MMRPVSVGGSPWVSGILNAEAVYGTVLAAGLISAFSFYSPELPALIARTVGTVVVFWAAHVYAELVGNRDARWRSAVREALNRSAGLLWSLIVPVTSLAIAAVLQLTVDQATNLALWSAVGILAVLGWWAARQRGTGLWAKALTAAATAAMGLVLIALKAFVH